MPTVNGGAAAAAAEIATPRRRHRRVRVPAQSFVTLHDVSCGNPRLRLCDISALGLGCEMPVDLLAQAPFGIPATVQLANDTALEVELCTRYDRTAGESRMLGFELTRREASPEWHRVLDSLLHPFTRTASTLSSDLWDLYGRSGYFSIAGKSAADFASFKTGFLRVDMALARAPFVGARIVWQGNTRLEGTVTVLKPYAKTWLDCQLARAPGEPEVGKRTILHQLLRHALEYPQRDYDFSWLLTYVRHDTRFSRHLKQDFVRATTNDGRLAAIVPFRALEASALRDPGPKAASHVRYANASDIDALATYVASVRPHAYVEALDLVPTRLDLADARRAWQRASLSRGREILVAERSGRAVAFAVLENAEPGSHLVGLLDAVRIFEPLGPDNDGCAALLGAARHLIHGRQRNKLFYLCERDDWRFAEKIGFTDMGSADTVVIASSLLPAHLEHLAQMTG